MPAKLLDRFIARLSESERLVTAGTFVRLPDFRVQLNPRQRELLDRVLAALETGGVNSPSPEDLALDLHVPRQAVQEVLKLGVDAGEAIRIAEGIYYTSGQMEGFKSKLRQSFEKRPFAASEFRDLMETSRKYAIPLLEYMDSVRATTRVGDNRIAND
jgi:selenocysteine-specific elongation factor